MESGTRRTVFQKGEYSKEQHTGLGWASLCLFDDNGDKRTGRYGIL